MRRALLVLASVLVALVCSIGTASAADDANAPAVPTSTKGVTITETDTSHFPMVRIAFGADEVDGRTPPLTFKENNHELSGVSVYRGALGSYEDRTRADVMLVVDTSLSMSGTRIEDATAAAHELVSKANPGDRIGLATFGGDAKVVLKPTADRQAIADALTGLQLENRTTMFDAVDLAARAFAKKGNARRAIVVISDGTDVGSSASLDDAAASALERTAPIYAVAIRENADDQPRDLAKLGNGTGGELRTVVGTDGLDELFGELGRRILQPYWIEYRSAAPSRSQVEFRIDAAGAGRAKELFRAVASPSAAAAAQAGYQAPKAAHPAKPLVHIPDGPLGIALVALPFGLLLFILSWGYLQKRSTPDVVARIERYTTRVTSESIDPNRTERSLVRGMAAPFLSISESALGTSAYFSRIRARAEQAAIAVRPAELFTAQIGLGLLFGLLALLITGGVLGGIIGLVVGGLVPNVWLRMKARKRRRKFDSQLPDVLQGIASSLRAGHSFHQALNALIRDAPTPTNEEFQRVMTESRLGMPVEDALQHMADRMGSPDFDFAVTTVNIQRTVGGSLADILEMVGDTVRNRQQFRQKVKALTSMGQMSAYVLLAMPVFMGLVIGVMSPMYMRPLISTSTGHMMIAAGCFSMFLGYLSCMKIVNVKV